MNRVLITLAFLFFPTVVFTQSPMPPKSAAEILHDIKRLKVTGKVLYMAAHPDDENQRVITWLGRGQGLETGYLALTRGDGGQNLIGNEKGPSLGILRTQELLGARRIDGGKQFFTRAYDFGYSKTPEETLTKWAKDSILADVVWVIRNFRPDIIITRFATPEKGGGGHGHHTTSAILAHEAFDLAGDPNAFPEQLAFVDVWQPKRLFWNNYWVFRRYDPTEEELEGIFPLDIGEYDPLLGMTYGEIASQARSMHKCQAFGAAWIRGSMTEYLEYEKGDKPLPGDFMSGINTGWSRFGLPDVDELLAETIDNFNAQDPESTVDKLLKVLKIVREKHDALMDVSSMEEAERVSADADLAPKQLLLELMEQEQEIERLIMYLAGVWVEANTPQPVYAAGQPIEFQIEALNRGKIPVTLTDIIILNPANENPEIQHVDSVLVNAKEILKLDYSFTPGQQDITQPYWLSNPNPEGIFTVPDKQMIGSPENESVLSVKALFEIKGVPVNFHLPLRHRYVDRAVGELYRPVVVAPSLTINMTEPIYLFGSSDEQEVKMVARGMTPGNYEVVFETPEGWAVAPVTQTITITESGQELPVSITVTPPEGSSVGELNARIHAEGMEPYSLAYEEIAYGHIPTQVWFPRASSKLARVSLEKRGKLIGYIVGSGDEVPEALRQVGYEVEIIDPASVTAESLTKYDAVVCGIRAYNTLERISYIQSQVLEYVEKGGTYIVQYQTSYGMIEEQVGPFPMTLGRDRISVEEAELTFLDKDHPALTTPNKLGEEDFQGWVQERGLYFASEWDEALTPLLEGHDPGEEDIRGALLVGQYGDGYFVYTGISFFRELPAGVPGAFRLFVNLISLGKDPE